MNIRERIISTLLIFIACIYTLRFFNIKANAADFSDKYELYEEWDSELKDYSFYVSQQLDIPYSAIIAIIYHESRFQSDVGSTYKGLMQVGSSTDILNFLQNCGMNLIGSDLYDPYVNILAGSYILDYAIDKSNSIGDAFYIYTCGEGNVKNRNKKGLSYNKATIEILEIYYDFDEYFINKLNERNESKEHIEGGKQNINLIINYNLCENLFHNFNILSAGYKSGCDCIPIIGANGIEMSNNCNVHKQS